MFNFNLQNRAFEELNAEQFRMIYFLNNTLSMVNEKHNTSDNDKVEMFNGYMMDKLGLSERQVQRLIKSLEDSGFISVERATRKKSPNIITINSDKNCDKNCDKNVTLNNILLNTIILLSTMYTMEFLKNGYPNGLSPEDMNDGVLDEMRTYIVKRMNERSDNGATEMNDTIPSTLENTINTMETDPNPAPSTEDEIKRQEESMLFNAGHDKHRYDICHNVKSTADYERFYGLLQKDIDYVKNSDWAQTQKDIWFNAFNKFWNKCEPYIKKNLNKVQEREKRRMQKEEEKRNKNSNTTVQQPIRYLEDSIKPIDVRIFQYWINEREKANTQEQKNNAQNMIDTVLSEWSGKYDADSIAKVCQECNLKASGEHQTANVEQLPTEDKTMQYKPLEEECGDFVNDNLKIYCINKPSAQVAN